MFVVVRNTKSAQNNLDYKLNKGDVIKLGRIKFNVKDFKSKYHGTSEKKQPKDEVIPEVSAQIEEEKKQCNGCSDHTPKKQMIHDNSLDSLTQECEEEVIEIDCGVVDPTQDIQCKVCWEKCSTPENPLLNSC